MALKGALATGEIVYLFYSVSHHGTVRCRTGLHTIQYTLKRFLFFLESSLLWKTNLQSERVDAGPPPSQSRNPYYIRHFHL